MFDPTSSNGSFLSLCAMQIGATFFKCEISTLSLFSKEACAFEVLNKVNSPLNPSEPRARHNFAQFSKILFDTFILVSFFRALRIFLLNLVSSFSQKTKKSESLFFL